MNGIELENENSNYSTQRRVLKLDGAKLCQLRVDVIYGQGVINSVVWSHGKVPI